MDELLDKLDDLGAETDDALERFMDDEEMYLKYVKAFPEEESFAKLKAAVEAKDYAAAEKAVHAMKGVVNNLGFLPVADCTVDMLTELRAGNIDDALEAYKDLGKVYNEFCDVIKELRAKA